MSNVVQKRTNTNMYSHIESSFKIIDEYLPPNYASLVSLKIKENKFPIDPSQRTIRNVRNKNTGYQNQILIIKALVEVSLDNKKHIENLIQLVNS